MLNLGERDVQDSGQARHPIARHKGKDPIVPNDVDTPLLDRLSALVGPTLSPPHEATQNSLSY